MADIDLEHALRQGPADLGPPPEDIAERAVREGLLDVAYVEADSPLGPLLLATTRRGLVRVAYLAGMRGRPDTEREEAVLDGLAADVSPRVMRAPAQLDEVRRELDEYFAGRRERFELRIDWSPLAGFRRDVLRQTARIPYGVVRTYGEVAGAAGSPRGARAAGNALGSNPLAIVVPCHRVVAAGHRIGGYTGGLDKKEFLLRVEGVTL